MTLEDILRYIGSGITLQAVECVMAERNSEEVSEKEIEARIETMDRTEMIEGIANGFTLMHEHPEYSELEEADFESVDPDDFFEEIQNYLRHVDSQENED